ncbi:MAG: hypothetical protein ACD_2C00037G0012 [uncultured bacterium (gcode 4)]|uniref:Uncharacterized protein n=1 Tax=uncultured bacterium (gcode 4) TaxID=1234023 RepID=K2G4J9_9BACT|nr:MAG: hypothetical protein ACD_2C00037G0012 [uncultured bacterium (gcode 4)]
MYKFFIFDWKKHLPAYNTASKRKIWILEFTKSFLLKEKRPNKNFIHPLYY